MIKCTKCGRENDNSFFYCIDCGNELLNDPKTTSGKPSPTSQPAAKKHQPGQVAKPTAKPVNTQTCPHCNATVVVDSIFCTGCGLRLDQPPNKGRTVFMHQATQAEATQPNVKLVLIKPDGSEADTFPMTGGKATIGRTSGSLMFSNDPYVSPLHAEITLQNGKLTVRDLNSFNGVYWRVTDQVQISPGAYFRIGRQLLRLELPGESQPINLEIPKNDDSRFWGSPPPQPWARLVQVLDGGKIGEIHLLIQPEITIGREEGDVRFSNDPFISSRHTGLRNDQGDCLLRDLDSSNGTYLKIQKSRLLRHEDRIQVGNQVLKVDIS